MKSDRIRVSPNFKKLLDKERTLLAEKLGIRKNFISYTTMSDIIQNKLSGKPTKLKITKKRVMIY